MKSPTRETRNTGGADGSPPGKTIDAMIREFMDEKGISGLTLAIVQAPYIPRVVGYGFCDVEQKRLVSTGTLFPAGPISQAYTAVAVMQLCEDGKLRLDARLDSLLSDLPDAWGGIQVLQLLRHCSGIADYRLQEGYDAAGDLSCAALLALVRDVPPAFEPGTDVALSATNFLLLAEIVEKVSGMPYRDFVTERQIRFLGLRHTAFSEDLSKLFQEDLSRPGTLHSAFKQDVRFVNPTETATGYDGLGDRIEPGRTPSLKGFADIWASAADISFWDIGLAGSILIRNPENRALLYGPFTLKNGRRIPAVAGWQFYRHRGLMDIKGSVPGYSSFLSRFTDPAELVCVTLLANKEGVDLTDLGRRIAGTFGQPMGTGYNDHQLELHECVYDVPQTVDRIKAALARRNVPVFAEFDHERNALEAKLELRPTRVIVFGAPAVGTRLMRENQSVCIELPLRIAVWEDAKGSVWLAFPRLEFLAQAYALEDNPVPGKMKNLLRALAAEASGAY